MIKIERVARAIQQWATPYNTWDDQTDDTKERWRNAARAAIAVMRK